MASVLANFMILWALIAWILTRWMMQSRLDAQLYDIRDNKMAIALIILLYVLMFYYIIVLTAIATLAIAYLIKFLLLDFFNIPFPQTLIADILSFAVSARHIKFNLLVIGLFFAFACMTIITTTIPTYQVLRSKIETLYVLFLVLYISAFLVFSL